MELKLHRHLWGMTEAIGTAFPKFKEFGYTGIETGVEAYSTNAELRDLIAKNSFSFIGMIFPGGQTVKEMLADYRKLLEKSASLKVQQLTCHSGRDHWSIEEGLEFYHEAVVMEQSMGLKVGHETHRLRFFYNPWNTRAVLEKVPQVQLCCDFSHWVVVCERIISDCEAILRLCADRCLHVHSRVGYEEGPQVPDPSAPEYQKHLEAHEQWWDMIFDAQAKTGRASLSLTPEFGPPNYMHTIPHTNVPVADLWKVCDWIADRQRKRFNAGKK